MKLLHRSPWDSTCTYRSFCELVIREWCHWRGRQLVAGCLPTLPASNRRSGERWQVCLMQRDTTQYAALEHFQVSENDLKKLTLLSWRSASPNTPTTRCKMWEAVVARISIFSSFVNISTIASSITPVTTHLYPSRFFTCIIKKNIANSDFKNRELLRS